MPIKYSTYSAIHAELYTGKKYCFFRVYNDPRPYSKEDLCPFDRELMTSLYTKLLPVISFVFFDPQVFIESLSITRNDPKPKILLIPSDVKIKMPKTGWVHVPTKQSTKSHEISTDSMMERHSTELTPNVIVKYSQRESSYDIEQYYRSSDEDLAKYRDELVLAEAMFDDYFHNPDEDGNLACNGISMKDDREGCEAYQERHPDICKSCTRALRVRL